MRTKNKAGGKQSACEYSLVASFPHRAVLDVARIVKEGLKKYEADNWRKISRCDHKKAARRLPALAGRGIAAPTFLATSLVCRNDFGYNACMKLTLQLQLLPNSEQKADLLATMERFNEAATFAAEQGFAAKLFGQVNIHKLAYRAIRERFGLSAQMAVRAIAKAVETFRRDKSKCPKFKKFGAITYDERVLSFKGLTEVSLWGLAGRHRMSFVCGDYQKALQGRIKGQCDLVYRDKKFFLLCTIDMPDGAPIQIEDALGVDLGIVNIATDSSGEVFSGSKIEEVRRHYTKRRAALNRVGTKSARRRLSKIRKREANYRRDVNHCIAKRLVAKAKAAASVIVLEDLKGIRKRVSVKGKGQRARHSGWSFFQLRSFVEYKAKLAGVPVLFVDPRNTSRTCSQCGHCAKGNRKNQAEFRCLHCNYSTNADYNAALNLRAKAVVNLPMVGIVDAKTGNLRECG